MQTPHESFHIMQDDWRQEIEEVLLELRRKEKVSPIASLVPFHVLILVFIAAARDRRASLSRR